MLRTGETYTRARLRQLLDTSDATINTGVFRPKGWDSVLLFVTENKTPDRTQFADRLDGDLLHWQGQLSGRTDAWIIEHVQRGLELLLFYRTAKYQFDGAAFSYEGSFRYVSHTGSLPASFVLERVTTPAVLPTDWSHLESEAAQAGDFSPQDLQDARHKVLAAIVRRRGQAAFRQALLSAYEGRCAITGCAVPDVLEAAHIHPYRGQETNRVDNGLLLRADLHTLFDLGLLSVNAATMVVEVSMQLSGTEYAALHGRALTLPAVANNRPSLTALEWHRENVVR